MTVFWHILTSFGMYVLGFLTASILASGKIADLQEQIDLLTFGGWRK